MRALVPLYVHPLENPAIWAAVARLGERVTVIVNVHDGPGEHLDASYRIATAAIHRNGVDTLGYVDLDYGDRAEAEVLRDVRRWRRYHVGGIFYDRTPSSAQALPQVSRVVRAAYGQVVINPGTRPDRGYAGLRATVCTFEGPWQRYLGTGEHPDWPQAAHLVYGVPRHSFSQAIRRLRRRVACGLVTNLDWPLPYHGLPTSLAAAARVA